MEEYAEKLKDFYSSKTADFILDILCTATNVVFSEPYYQWNLINEDPDDNKFSNLALSVNAHCLVTYDKHFNIFKEIDFPRLKVITPKKFKYYLKV